jgi:DNA processing protein
VSEPVPAASDDHVAAVALAALHEMTPSRLRLLIEHFGTATAALRAVTTGPAIPLLLARVGAERRDVLAAAFAAWPAKLDVERTRSVVTARRARIWLDGDNGYPIPDPLPHRPALLLAEGAGADVLDAPRVAIVGTRAATPHGKADAHELGATLGDAGVTVVSGLAIGIDAAAHEGVLDAGGGAIGVVATGLDIEYPRRHRALYRRMREHGLVLGETGYGIGPEPGRFPVRNRIIAALADLVIVVEATLTGGARITAEHALRYDRPVFAVPGSRRNAAAAGTNALIADGAYPLTDWSDVVLALGMTPGARRRAPTRPPPDTAGRAVLAALGGEPASPEQLAGRTALEPHEVALAVAALERAGWVNWKEGYVWPR